VLILKEILESQKELINFSEMNKTPKNIFFFFNKFPSHPITNISAFSQNEGQVQINQHFS
jgi:hypothetical protein